MVYFEKYFENFVNFEKYFENAVLSVTVNSLCWKKVFIIHNFFVAQNCSKHL